MSAYLYAVARTMVQAGWGWLVAHVSVLAVIPESTAVDFILSVVVIGGAVAALRWLETRHGDALWQRLARSAARVLMLGLSGKQPVYVEPGQSVRVVTADGTLRSPR